MHSTTSGETHFRASCKSFRLAKIQGCPGSQHRVLTENCARGFSPRTLRGELPSPTLLPIAQIAQAAQSPSAEFPPRSLRWELHQVPNPGSRDSGIPGNRLPVQSSRRELSDLTGFGVCWAGSKVREGPKPFPTPEPAEHIPKPVSNRRVFDENSLI